MIFCHFMECSWQKSSNTKAVAVLHEREHSSRWKERLISQVILYVLGTTHLHRNSFKSNANTHVSLCPAKNLLFTHDQLHIYKPMPFTPWNSFTYLFVYSFKKVTNIWTRGKILIYKMIFQWLNKFVLFKEFRS